MSESSAAESQLQQLNRELEERVAARTGELEAANLALRAGEKRLRDMLESVLHGLVLVDRQGRVELVNRQLEAMFGYSRETLVGSSIEQLMPNRYRARHGGLMASFFANPSRRDMAGRMELYGRRADGVEFPVEIGLNPVESADGLRVLASITDVTARKAANRALQAGEERLRDVLESVLHGLVLVDRRGRVELVNRQLETMFGYPREALVGASIEQLMPERYRARHGGLMASFFANPSRRDMAGRMELYGRRADGVEFPVEIGLNPVESADGLRVLASITDVTARKAAQLQLQSALAEKTSLLNEVHHRVKNNLQVISSLLKMQARAAPAGVSELLTESCSRVQAMSMIHQLLYEHGNLSQIDLAPYLQQLLSLLRDTYGDRNRRIQTRFAGDVGACHLDMQRAISCGLVVNELITNSFKHAFPDGRAGTILVELRRPAPGAICLRVADDGVGLPPEAALGRGRSLGLRLLPSLAEQLGGELKLLQEQGVQFELTFADD